MRNKTAPLLTQFKASCGLGWLPGASEEPTLELGSRRPEYQRPFLCPVLESRKSIRWN